MDYEQKYNEALKEIRELISLLKKNDVITDNGIIESNLQRIFPELAESEDKKIIEEIKFAVLQMPSEREDTKQRCLAWLEKQKEQKPIKQPKFKIGDVVKFKGFGDEPADDTPLKIVGYDNELYLFDNGTTDLFSEQNLYELVEQKPEERFEEAREKYQVEWSEEEYGRLFDIEHYLDGTLQLSPDRRIACIDFLKSLRPSWKPSEEQMTNLLRAEGRLRIEGESVLASKLAELYNQLKKLM